MRHEGVNILLHILGCNFIIGFYDNSVKGKLKRERFGCSTGGMERGHDLSAISLARETVSAMGFDDRTLHTGKWKGQAEIGVGVWNSEHW
jgi:hypothetical protein